MISACEQCGRNVVPEIAAPCGYDEWLAGLAPASGGALRLLFSPHATSRLAELVRPAEVTLLAGPEGGYSEPEVERALKRGFVAVRMGPRVLRTETAALAALSAINTLWGDF
jgi:16S rRNA (uracil1498-N3)-methyltransferase